MTLDGGRMSVECGNCDLTADVELFGLDVLEVPPSRHTWSDILACPLDGCGRQFLIRNIDALRAAVTDNSGSDVP